MGYGDCWTDHEVVAVMYKWRVRDLQRSRYAVSWQRREMVRCWELVKLTRVLKWPKQRVSRCMSGDGQIQQEGDSDNLRRT